MTCSSHIECSVVKVWQNAVPVPSSEAEYSSGGDKPTYNLGIHKERHILQADTKQQLPVYVRKASIQSLQIRWRSDRQCRKAVNSSVPAGQCPELNKTNRIDGHISIGNPVSSLSS